MTTSPALCVPVPVPGAARPGTPSRSAVVILVVVEILLVALLGEGLPLQDALGALAAGGVLSGYLASKLG